MSEPKPGGGSAPAATPPPAADAATATEGSERPKNEVAFPDNTSTLGTTSLETSTSSSSISHPPVTIFKLTKGQRILAGSGHVLNDLCASLWFTYLLLYMQKVVKFNDAYAAGLLLWGQVIDGVSTPLVGYETDHVASLFPCRKTYGRCKSWHLLGIILVMISFPFIFSPCVGYSFYTNEWSRVADWKKAIYYGPFIAIFQIGWACTQISHLALIPKLTPDDLIRTEILAIRYAFTVGANITVFLMTWMFLSHLEKTNNQKCSVDTDDSATFSYIAIISVGLGGLFSLLFHLCVDEKSDNVVKRSVSLLKIQESMTDLRDPANEATNSGPNNNPTASGGGGDRPVATETRRLIRTRTPTNLRQRDGAEGASLLASDNEDDAVNAAASKGIRRRASAASSIPPQPPRQSFSTKTLNAGKERMGVCDWMKLPQFYMVAGLYLCTRLAVNLSQTYMPFYVEVSLALDCSAVAIIPLTMYCSGFVHSLVIKLLNKYLGRQIAYAIGTLLIVIGAGLILFLDWSGSTRSWAIYVVAVFIGGGSSVILVTSLSITADLIGNNVESGAFVYGAMSFCDKISCGIGVVLINLLLPCKNDTIGCASENKAFYTDALGFSTGGSALSGLMFILFLTFIIIRKHIAATKTPVVGVVSS